MDIEGLVPTRLVGSSLSAPARLLDCVPQGVEMPGRIPLLLQTEDEVPVNTGPPGAENSWPQGEPPSLLPMCSDRLETELNDDLLLPIDAGFLGGCCGEGRWLGPSQGEEGSTGGLWL